MRGQPSQCGTRYAGTIGGSTWRPLPTCSSAAAFVGCAVFSRRRRAKELFHRAKALEDALEVGWLLRGVTAAHSLIRSQPGRLRNAGVATSVRVAAHQEVELQRG